MNNYYNSLNILLVDDNEDDVLMARKAFAQLNFPHKLETALSAQGALDYLRCSGSYTDRKPVLPDLLLLDINMPLMDGFALLKLLKADPCLKKIPVIMLTSSSAREDVSRSYECGAASYLTKPESFEGFKNLMYDFGRYWLTVSALPQ
jgi:CheY-like chemotaxis protein